MSKRLDAVRESPKAGWTIADVAAVCREALVVCEPARAGDSHKVSHASRTLILTIPYKRPIKPIYNRKLVAFVDAVRAAQ